MNDKIPFYNIANMFFVGCVFTLLLVVVIWDILPIDTLKNYGDILSNWMAVVSILFLTAMFEVGFIINRLGSIIVEPLYVNCKIWPREKYDVDVSEISQDNRKFQSMITELNLMRSHIMMSLILLIVSVCLCKWIYVAVLCGLIAVFTLGGRKHNKKINLIRTNYSLKK